MKNIIILSVFVFALISCQSTKKVSQTSSDEVLMTVGNSKVAAGEFEYAYLKNNHLDKKTEDKKSDIEEYLELYKNFKLKVIEAETLGRDTTTSFISEFETYERQLAEPYLATSKVSDINIKEGYERMKEEISASHILINLPEEPSPEDTLKAYNKVMSLRERILAGEDFEAIAKEESDDPSAAQNGGDLGYFTAMQMVLPFEITAYNTPKGEVSQPARTRFGYHLIYVKDRIPTRDQIKVAHIMLRPDENGDTLKTLNKINSIHNELEQGESWNTLCQSFSDDEYTKDKGGELPFIRPGRIDPDFEKAAFELDSIGDYSKPFQTKYGWHIVKLVDTKDAIQSFEEAKPQIDQNLSRYGNILNKKKSAVTLLKKENGYMANAENLSSCKANILKPSDTYDKGSVLFELDGQQFSCDSFMHYVTVSRPFDTLSNEDLAQLYDSFESETILTYEKDVLLRKNKDYRYLRQEYRDGILLFSIMEDSVWNKASSDTLGLKNFFDENKNSYPKPESAEVIHISAKNQSDLASIMDMLKNTHPDSLYLIEEMHNKEDPLSVKISTKVIEKGKNEHLDANWSVGVIDYTENDRFHALKVIEIIPSGFKELNQIKGKVISDYQNFVESKWIAHLKTKYPVVLNDKVLENLVQKLSNETN